MISDTYYLEPIRQVNQAARKINRIGEARLRRNTGFGIGQIPVLAALRNGNSLQQVELAQLAGIEQPSMAAILKRMERDGLIERVANPMDKRSHLLKLTKLARSRLGDAHTIMVQGNKEALKGFSLDEITTLISLMKRVNNNLDEALTKPFALHNAREEPGGKEIQELSMPEESLF